MNFHIRFLFQKKGNRELAISGVVSKHWKNIFIFLWFIEIDISLITKDWMIKDRGEIINGKSYEVFIKNPKYIDEEPRGFCFPKVE
jgi:hypothetical protein